MDLNINDVVLKAFCDYLLYGCMIPGVPTDPDIIRGLLTQSLLIEDEHFIDLRLPLFFAVQSGNVDSVKLLLDYGADPYYTKPWGLPALTLAVFLKHYSIVKMLIQRKDLDINKIDPAYCSDRYFNQIASTEINSKWISKSRQANMDFGQFQHVLEVAGNDLTMIQYLSIPGRTKVNIKTLQKAYAFPNILECLLKTNPDLNTKGKTLLDFCFNGLFESAIDSTESLQMLMHRGARFDHPSSSILKYRQETGGRCGLARLNRLRWISISRPYDSLFIRKDIAFKEFVVDLCFMLREEQVRLFNAQSCLIRETSEIDVSGRQVYTASLIRNFLHHLSVCNSERLPLSIRELKYLFDEDIKHFPEETNTELGLLIKELGHPLSLKILCRIAILSLRLSTYTLVGYSNLLNI